jgi:hypothetical protein
VPIVKEPLAAWPPDAGEPGCALEGELLELPHPATSKARPVTAAAPLTLKALVIASAPDIGLTTHRI